MEERNPVELDEFESEFDSASRVKEGSEIVEERLWFKLEKFGKKISFARDVVALYQYLIDRRVSWHRKTIVVGALIYFIAPIDTIPDIAPLVGYLDDLGVITAVLKFLGSELIPYYEKD
ncbi:MAG: DUF1232 domain-containing protein [Melioribacteraceae bacterium]|nr:DUF1232 domain-containing protein [Melioribacteraceae bacterium]